MKDALKHSRKPGAALVFGGGVLLAALVATVGENPLSQAALSGQPVSRSAEDIPTRLSNVKRESLAPTVKKVAPAVVKIVTSIAVGDLAGFPAAGSEDASSRYFLGQMPRRDLRFPLLHGLGSGVIVTEDGYILTNNHIIEGAKDIKVTLQDGREFKARIIGTDTQSDIAVIKVDATSLPTVPLAQSRNVEVGDLVLAIGNPFGVGQTVTHGIVSATDRGGVGIEDFENFIQTDAPINPGNSGGALVDADGALIGINTAILSGTGGNQGIGFAIPSDLARRVMTDLVKFGHVLRGYLGVEAQDLTPELATEFNIAPAVGALVGSVTSNEPADKAGLKVGDVITRFDGQEVRGGRQLKLAVAEVKPGMTVSIEVLRNGSPKVLHATVGAPPNWDRLGREDLSFDEKDPCSFEGVGLVDTDNLLRRALRIPPDVRGAVVFRVEPGSAAFESGLRPGDVIQSVNRHEVKDAEEAAHRTKNATNKRTLLRVWRGGSSHFILMVWD